MSTDNVAVAINVIQTVTSTTDRIITINNVVHETVTAGTQGPQGPQGVSGATTLSSVTDVNMAGLTDGALLVYNAQTELWNPTTVLEKQALECGQY